MSLYNMMFGRNPDTDEILGWLDLTADDFKRFRDVSVIGNSVMVYARLGGGNRYTYQTAIRRLQQHPFYEKDWDASFDATYLHMQFQVPPAHRERASQLQTEEPDPTKRWEKLFTALEKDDPNDPLAQKAKAVGAQIMNQINSGKSGTVSDGKYAVDVIAGGQNG